MEIHGFFLFHPWLIHHFQTQMEIEKKNLVLPTPSPGPTHQLIVGGPALHGPNLERNHGPNS